MVSRDRIQKQIERLSLADKQALRSWLETEITRDQQPPEVKLASGREIVETAQVGRITYQNELIKCSKPNCRCAT